MTLCCQALSVRFVAAIAAPAFILLPTGSPCPGFGSFLSVLITTPWPSKRCTSCLIIGSVSNRCAKRS